MTVTRLSGLVIQHEETGFMDPTGFGWWGFFVTSSGLINPVLFQLG